MSGVEMATILPGFSGTLLEFHGALYRALLPRTGPGNNNNYSKVEELHSLFHTAINVF